MEASTVRIKVAIPHNSLELTKAVVKSLQHLIYLADQETTRFVS
jgi:hypothetical protein